MRIRYASAVLLATTSLCASAVDASTFVLSAASLDFGDMHRYATSPGQTVSLTNVGTETANPFLAGGAPSNTVFSGSQSCGANSLDPGQSCELTFRFTPTADGPQTGVSSLSIGGETHSIQLSGNGIPGYRLSARSLVFPNTDVGSFSPSQSVQITNISSQALNFQLAGGAPSNTAFSGSQNCAGNSLDPGQSCQVTYQFAPTSESVEMGQSVLSIQGDTIAIDLAGQGGAQGEEIWHLSPRSLDFGPVYIGDPSPAQTVTLTNVSDTTDDPALAGGAPNNTQFSGSQNCAGGDLAADAACQINFSLTPTTLGEITGQSNLSVGGEQYSIELAGLGLFPFLVSPNAFDFGDVAVGDTSLIFQVYIRNLSGSSLPLNLAGGAPGNTDFFGSQNCGGGLLAVGAFCSLFFQFSPSQTGVISTTSNFSLGGRQYSIGMVGFGLGDPVDPSPVPLPPILPAFALVLLAPFLRKRS